MSEEEARLRMNAARDRARTITARVRQIRADATKERAAGNKDAARIALSEIGKLSEEVLALGADTSTTLKDLLRKVEDLKKAAEEKK